MVTALTDRRGCNEITLTSTVIDHRCSRLWPYLCHVHTTLQPPAWSNLIHACDLPLMATAEKLKSDRISFPLCLMTVPVKNVSFDPTAQEALYLHLCFIYSSFPPSLMWPIRSAPLASSPLYTCPFRLPGSLPPPLSQPPGPSPTLMMDGPWGAAAATPRMARRCVTLSQSAGLGVMLH